MNRFYRYCIASVLALITFTGCIENDIPYPYVELYITGVEGDGVSKTSISNSNRTVTLTLEEQVDIQSVNLTDVSYTEGATLSNSVVGVHDMNMDLHTTLSLYQDYYWVITAQQTIERYFTVDKQLSAAVIDVTNRTASIVVDEGNDVDGYYDLSNVTGLSLKLAADGVYDDGTPITTYDPAIADLTDFTGGVRNVKVTSHGRMQEWRVYITTATPQLLVSANAWAKFVTLEASGVALDGAAEYGFEYYPTALYSDDDDSRWSYAKVVATSNGSGGFTAVATNLNPQTGYTFRAYVDSTISELPVSVTTEAVIELPNSSFEEWTITGSRSWWEPYAEGTAEADIFWNTGNYGSSIGGSNLTIESSDIPAVAAEDSSSAYLFSKVISGKFAAGSVYSGKFIDVDVTDGMLNFGRPFTSRPVALRGWVKYTSATVSDIHSNLPASAEIKEGGNDQGTIYIMLGTWVDAVGTKSGVNYGGTDANPVRVETKYSSTVERLDSEGDDIIAYGGVVYSNSIDEWTQFEIKLNYYDELTTPTHIIVVASSSRYGDYFSGGVGSEMWLDELELVYDYE
ncbi:MAG: PCMD domain-containing protein [Rikenellaceae bacterium]